MKFILIWENKLIQPVFQWIKKQQSNFKKLKKLKK